MDSTEVVYGNVKSNKFDGILVDARNVNGIEKVGTSIYLNCHFSEPLLISEYAEEIEAEEDAQIYANQILNPMIAGFIITNSSLLRGYIAQSDEFRELSMSIIQFKDER